MDWIQRTLAVPKDSFFLFGPRGTGKSTWLAQRFPDALRIDLLDPRQYEDYLAKPSRLLELLSASPKSKDLWIDEVQRVPELLDVVHHAMESEGRHNRRFMVTGSSARKLRRDGANLLAGRLLLKHMHPFLASELGDRFDLKKNLRLGMLPVVLGSPDPEGTLASYVAGYLREEVKAEGIVRNLSQFARFLEAASFSQAAVISVSSIARECQVERKSVENYLNVLEDLLLAFRLPVFTRRAKRRLVTHPKFYYVDCGVYQSLRPRGPLDRNEEVYGLALESLVAQHLRAWIDYSSVSRQLFFWRTSEGTEVDFIVYGADCFYAIEVKSSRNASAIDLASLKSFRREYPEAQALMVYGGEERRNIDGITLIPAVDFLREMKPDKTFSFWSEKKTGIHE